MSGIESTKQLRLSDFDMFGHLKYSVILSEFQNIADMHTVMCGVTPEVLDKHNAAWVVARMWLRIYRQITDAESVVFYTEARPQSGIQFIRDFEIRSPEGVVYGDAISSWVLIDRTTREFLTPRAAAAVTGEASGDGIKTEKIERFRQPENMKYAFEKVFGYSDTDMNGHVNNARYIDAVCDACGLEHRKRPYISDMHINYKTECLPGEKTDLFFAEDKEFCYVTGKCRETVRFEAKIKIESMGREL